MDSSLVYVTAFYNNIICRKKELVFEDFEPFLKSNLSILLFTDESEIPKEIYEHPKILVVTVPREEIQSFQFTNPSLPAQRNPEVDTTEFLSLMNAKTEFIKRAAEHVKADAYVWFDIGILRISKHHKQFIDRMERLKESYSLYPNQVLIPGCIKREKINFSNMFSFPIWRFCGGLYVVPDSCVETLHKYHMDELERCKALNTLTWEVNLFAAIERDHPELFFWYCADHNDSIVCAPLPQKPKKIILLSMIKNESKIIKRMIASCMPILDAVCICDTGSTDNTVEVLSEYFKDFPVPAKIYNGPEHEWKNFGHNRSQSFLSCVDYCKELQFDPENTYALVLDADMQLVIQPAFKKEDLVAIGYKIIQASGSLEYYNSRFLKLSHPWTCVGVTHEYWDGANTDTFGKDIVYISDIGDGGCKADKFERDVRLLEQGLIDSPNNPRYLFYLAQSYKDNGQIDKAIEYYKKRIDAGGWYEEIWYSMYQLMKLHAQKKQFPEMELWGMKAFEHRKERAENILYLCKHFKDKRQYWKAWHYYELGSKIKKPDDLLFLETDVYEKGFDFERCIIHDYVFPHKKQETLNYSLEYYNKYGEHCTYTNIQWFVEKIPGIVRPLHFTDVGDFVPTSTSILRLNDGRYRLNVRYVNYRIQPNGSYLMMDKGSLSANNPVRTHNYTCVMDSNFNIWSPLQRLEVQGPLRHASHIQGLEDVRIFNGSDGRLMYLGTSIEYSHDGKIRQVKGVYNVEKGMLENPISMKPPTQTDCEKNWIPYKGDKIIYKWHPFQIGSLDSENKLVIEKSQDTPRFLSQMRGSSTLVEDGGFYYGITHCVMYQQPRKYYHMVVKIDASTDRLVAYTNPFFFLNNAIEYVLGLEKRGDMFTAIVSQNDRNPVMIDFLDKDLHWKPI